MNRRNFLRSVLAGFTILPGAGRIWHATRKVVVPEFPYVKEYENYLRVVYTMMREREAQVGIPGIYEFTGSETIKFAWDDEPDAPLGWVIVEGKEGSVVRV